MRIQKTFEYKPDYAVREKETKATIEAIRTGTITNTQILKAALDEDDRLSRITRELTSIAIKSGKYKTPALFLNAVYETLYDCEEIPLQMRFDLCRTRCHMAYLRECLDMKLRLVDCVFLRTEFIRTMLEKAGIKKVGA